MTSSVLGYLNLYALFLCMQVIIFSFAEENFHVTLLFQEIFGNNFGNNG